MKRMAENQNNKFLRNLQQYYNRVGNKNEENMNNNNKNSFSRLFNYVEEHYPHHENKNDPLNEAKREILAKRAKRAKPANNQNKLNDEFLKYLNSNNNNNPYNYMTFVKKYYPHLLQNNNYQGNMLTNVKKAILAKRAKRNMTSPVKKTAMSWLSRVRKRLTQPRGTGNMERVGNIVKLPRFGVNRARKQNENIAWNSYKLNEGNLVQNNARSKVSQAWLRKQAAYIKGLSDYDFKTLLAYTLNSSLWVGQYERTGKLPNISNYHTFNYSVLNAANKKKAMRDPNWVTKPLVPQIRKILNDPSANVQRVKKNNSLHRKALDMYRADLHRIIRNAPALPANLIVYRGLGTDPFKGSVGAIHRIKGFSSSSYHSSWGTYYMRGSDPILQRIKLLRGTHVIAASIVNPWESRGQGEIIINSGTKYIVRARNVLRHVLNRGAPDKVRVTDITVIPDGPSNKNINK